MEPSVGSEAIAAGELTKSQLTTRSQRLFPDVYLPRGVGVDATVRAKAGRLWSGRRGVVAGFAAAALHGSKWADDTRVVELIHDNWRSPPGIQTRRDTWDVRRLESLERLGWIVVRVVAGDRPAEVVGRVRAALARRSRVDAENAAGRSLGG
jgi:hypothetical protein